jgi:hypothetical protein
MKAIVESMIVKIILNFLLIMASLSAFNQVIYYDINPDTTITEDNGHYDLDFINDDFIDFQLRLQFHDNATYGHIEVLINNDSCFVLGVFFAGEGCYEAERLILNDTINAFISNKSQAQWYNRPSLLMAYSGLTWCHGLFYGGWNDVYLALKWIDKSVPYVCWVRLDVAEDASWFTVKDYAYGPYTVIAGSQTSTYLIELKEKDQFNVYRKENNIIVKAKNGVNLKHVKLFNLISQQFHTEFQNNEVIIYNNQLLPGLYLLYLSTDQGNSTIKIIIN